MLTTMHLINVKMAVSKLLYENLNEYITTHTVVRYVYQHREHIMLCTTS